MANKFIFNLVIGFFDGFLKIDQALVVLRSFFGFLTFIDLIYISLLRIGLG